MWNQTVTVYHKTEQDDRAFYRREVLNGVQLSKSETETIKDGLNHTPASTLMVRGVPSMTVKVGDIVTDGLCPVESFSGNPGKALAGYSFGRVKTAKRYRFSSPLAHDTFFIE